MSEQTEENPKQADVLDDLNYHIERSANIISETTALKDQFENLKRLYDFIMLKQENGYNADYERYRYSKELDRLNEMLLNENMESKPIGLCGKRKREVSDKNQEEKDL
jgi:hypothetical protein